MKKVMIKQKMLRKKVNIQKNGRLGTFKTNYFSQKNRFGLH
jgi:hypothetical protein